MRLKLLFFPAIFLAVLVLLIWFIVPKYQEIGVLKDELKVVQTDLQNVQARQLVLSKLTSELNQSKVLESFVFQYIPLAKDEEYVINAVNNAATVNDVGLVSLNVGETSSPLFLSPEDAQVTAPTFIQADGSVLGSVNVPTPDLKEFTVEASVIGSYDNIKKFIVEAHKINRLQGVAMLNIERLESQNANQENQAQAANDVEVAVDTAVDPTLLGKFVLSFAYVPSVTVPRGADSPVFHREDGLGIEDMSSVQASLTVPPALDLESEQRNNPFIAKQD